MSHTHNHESCHTHINESNHAYAYRQDRPAHCRGHLQRNIFVSKVYSRKEYLYIEMFFCKLLLPPDTGWRRLIGSLKLQIIFHKRATKYRPLLWKMTYEDKWSYGFLPPFIDILHDSSINRLMNRQIIANINEWRDRKLVGWKVDRRWLQKTRSIDSWWQQTGGMRCLQQNELSFQMSRIMRPQHCTARCL